MMEWLQLGAPLASTAHWYINRNGATENKRLQQLVDVGRVAFAALSLYEGARFVVCKWEASPQHLIRQLWMPPFSFCILAKPLYQARLDREEADSLLYDADFHLSYVATLGLALTSHPGIVAAGSALVGQFFVQEDAHVKMGLGLASFAIGTSLLTTDLMRGIRLLSPLQRAQPLFNAVCTLAGSYLLLASMQEPGSS